MFNIVTGSNISCNLKVIKEGTTFFTGLTVIIFPDLLCKDYVDINLKLLQIKF